MRVVGILILLSSTLAADVAVLKDGSRVSGKVVEKAQSFEITTDSGLRTYLKEEVDKVIKDPKEILGNVDAVIEDAKADYQKALGLTEGSAEYSALLHQAITKVDQARQATSATRELFPEDKYADLDAKLMQIMQLKRLLRDRLRSELVNRAQSFSAPTPGVSSVSLEEAFSTLLDPSKRSDPAKRATARESFRLQRAAHPEVYELATAAMLFLSRSDAEWNLQGPSLAALQEYFGQSWMKQPGALTPAAHQAAAQWIVDRINALRKQDAKAQTEPISLFGIGHLGHAPAGGETDKYARLLGLEVRNGILGTPEGHAVRDLNSWIASGDFDLAVLAFIKEHRQTDTPIVRFVWSYALLRLVQGKKRGYERPISALQTVNVSDGACKDHIGALSKSIKTAAVCNVCQGEGKLRCTNCFGKKEIRTDCEKCKGKGKVPEQGYGAGFGGGGKFAVPEIPCYPCRGRGFTKLLRCEKCKDGFNDCRNCDRKPKTPPEMEEICVGAPCGQCDGRGYVFRNVLWACKSCMGLGQKLTPKSDPTKVLP